MDAAGHSTTAPNESDFTIIDHLNLKLASCGEYKCVARSSESSSETKKLKSNNLYNLKQTHSKQRKAECRVRNGLM